MSLHRPHAGLAGFDDERGPRLQLAEKANVPDSTPLFVKICSGKSCKVFVTFSGQQINFNGEPYDVLSDSSGNVILLGKRSVLTPNERASVRIEGRSLERL